MNKAFVREPERLADYCPRCGSQGQPVSTETLQAYLPDALRKNVSDPANFCPSPKCEVAYFDAFERIVLAADLSQPAYPKDPDAPICACFGLTRQDIEQDVREGVVTRVKAIIAKANSPEARCASMAANSCSCVAYVQKYYMQCRAAKDDARGRD
ncbi:MAG: hypothetical protein LLG00_08900 [Planctomycetaceae bacterium]|nr:hypothetical protein [Planctomycetaceae bacterium]